MADGSSYTNLSITPQECDFKIFPKSISNSNRILFNLDMNIYLDDKWIILFIKKIGQLSRKRSNISNDIHKNYK